MKFGTVHGLPAAVVDRQKPPRLSNREDAPCCLAGSAGPEVPGLLRRAHAPSVPMLRRRVDVGVRPHLRTAEGRGAHS